MQSSPPWGNVNSLERAKKKNRMFKKLKIITYRTVTAENFQNINLQFERY